MTTKYILFLFITFNSLISFASNNCFMAKENGKIIAQTGNCDARHSPFSTYKVPLALMGFESNLLKSTTEPLLDFTEDRKKGLGNLYNPTKHPIMQFWDNNHNPSSWLKYSVIWYSQYVMQSLGHNTVNNYLDKFNYGNKDISGTPGENDGLLLSWLDNSLQISPKEQLDFIEKLSSQTIPVSKISQIKTKEVIKLEEIWDGWQLYGKTGGSKKQGWFIGWIEKNDRKIAFVQYLEQPETSYISGGLVAKEYAKNNIIQHFHNTICVLDLVK